MSRNPLRQQMSTAIGGTWTPDGRPCSDCGKVFNHLTDLQDGRHVCIPCWFAPAYKAKDTRADA